MTYVDWRITGPELSACNCDWGCPCQFNALPTKGFCRAAVAMRIDSGHFGDVVLNGVRWLGIFAWPGPIHHGNGEALVVIDQSAGEPQRQALLTILSGAETQPGATIFNVFAAMLTTFHPPMFRPIHFDADMATARGSFRVEGLVQGDLEPIRNPVTGAEHRAQVELPDGFEYRRAEFASSTVASEGPIVQNWAQAHGHLAMLDLSTTGLRN